MRFIFASAKRRIKIFFSLFVFTFNAWALPTGFVYLKDIEPSIIQDMKYFSSDNFVGRKIKGYDAPSCIVTKKTAENLSNIQKKLIASGLSLKVYDCYRPIMAVQDFIQWSHNHHDQREKMKFYPNVKKEDFFKLGYVSKKSNHSKGNTVDVTLVKLASNQPTELDMGTRFDFMDESSHPSYEKLSTQQKKNRLLLRQSMTEFGFHPTSTEWWHFTYKAGSLSDRYFNFPIVPNSTQLLIVWNSNSNSMKGQLQRFSRNSSSETWKPEGEMISVVIGKNGMGLDLNFNHASKPFKIKREGDSRTPIGIYEISSVFGFEKKALNHQMDYVHLNDTTECVDDMQSKYYNQVIDRSLLSATDWNSSEQMRTISLYKMGAIVRYNTHPVVKGAGSCIFLHSWRSEHSPTAGCVAMSEAQLETVLRWLNKEKHPMIAMLPMSLYKKVQSKWELPNMQ